MKWDRERDRDDGGRRSSPYYREHDDRFSARSSDRYPARSSDGCLCCGRFGHKKAQCPDAFKTCDNCGLEGHLRSQCRHPPTCKACGSADHLKAECPYKDDICGLCGKVGHLRIRCHQQAASANTSHGFSTSSKECYACGSYDHVKADCPAKDKICDSCGKPGHIRVKCNMRDVRDARDVRGGRQDREPTDSGNRGGDRECFGCGSWNHLKADCPHKDKICDSCGLEGHLRATCRLNQQNQPGDRGGSGSRQECFGCGSWDHRKADCPHKYKICDTCGKEGHLAKKCNAR